MEPLGAYHPIHFDPDNFFTSGPCSPEHPEFAERQLIGDANTVHGGGKVCLRSDIKGAGGTGLHLW